MNSLKEGLITLLLTVTMIVGGLPFGIFAQNIDEDNNQVPVEDMEDAESQENLPPENNEKDSLEDTIPEEDIKDDQQVEDQDWQVFYTDKESGEELLPSKDIYGIKEEDINYMIKSNIEHIDGYEYDFYQIVTSEGDTNTLFLIYNKAVEDEFYYVTFNYIDIDTNEIIAKPLISDELVKGQKYDLTKYTERTLEGYKYVKTKGNISGIIAKNEQVDVYYKKYQEANFKVTIQYLDQDTNKEIAKSFVLEPGDKDYDVTIQAQRKIDGYKYVKTEGKIKGNLYKEDKNEIIKVYYEKIKTSSNVKTGDYNNLLLWIGIALVAVVLVFILIRKNKK